MVSWPGTHVNEPLAYNALFISCVSREHAELRKRIDADLSGGGHQIVALEDVDHAATDALLKIAALIQQSDAVVHVVGDDPGDFPSQAALQELLGERGPRDLLQALPEVRDLIQDFSSVSFAHWAVLLALHYKKEIFVYEPPSGALTIELSASQVAAQLEHRKRLSRAERFIERCEDDFEGSVWSVLPAEGRRSRISWLPPR